MTEKVVDVIILEVRENRKKIQEILERLVRVEERASRRATFYGLLGGILTGLLPLIYWIAKQ